MLPIDSEGLGRMAQGNLEVIGPASLVATIGCLDLGNFADQGCQ